MRILLLADIHIGAIKDLSYFEAIWDQILLKEVHVKQADMVVILGDYFDRLFKANEQYVTLAMNCMSRLVRACGKQTAIRIVYGTESHEMNQYGLFAHFMTSKSTDFRVFHTVTEEIFKGKSILYVPEEYVSSKEEAYKDTIYSKHYDYIFGHGMIMDGMPESVQFSHVPKKENHVPRFESSELSKAATVVAFGHYHVHRDIGNVHYVGSLFRWKFGEEEPKGYAVIEDDQFTFIENKAAYVFKTYEVQATSEEEVRQKLGQIEEENPSIFRDNLGGKVKIVFNTESSPTLYEKIRTDMLKSNSITTDMKYTPVTEETPEDEDEDLYEIVMSKSLTPSEKIRGFIQEKRKISIEIDRLNSYLRDPLNL